MSEDVKKAVSAAELVDQDENPMRFFAHNVDNWGALEWFNRMVDACEDHDRKRVQAFRCVDQDEKDMLSLSADTSKMIMSSSAFHLAREHKDDIRSALSAQVPDVTGSQNPSHDAYQAWLKRNGYPHTVARALAFEHGWRAHKKMAAPPAKPDGGDTYQERLLDECRFESGSLTEAGWTVPAIAASKPAGDTRFADEAPAKQEG
ncbi:hypothetical protein G6M14_08940 [Agrobacterium tumefaciens]|uniref:hypothetical protein n=1 Tax=Agrobacterium tumefaciens TaxID=358 RepID=UPI001571978B|nr:hypothetical protein [Agrobacterium tumefaciens]